MKTPHLIALLFCVGINAGAADPAVLTQQDISRLLDLKIPESTIIEKVKASGTAYVLGAEDIARLKKAGATEALIAAMQATASVPPAGNPASEITDLAIIVDYSGSMNAKMKDGATKVASAKKCVSELIDKLPGDLNVALIIYGTNKQRGCQDIDVIQPLGPMNKASLKLKINGYNATGMTPIASSLTVAGDELKKAKGGPAIVLVTDGAESCHGDPVGVAAKLAAEFGIQFGINVIGFGIEPNEKAGLAAIAEKGHGKLLTVETASELTDALKKVVAEKVAPPAPPQRAMKQYEAAGAAVKPGLFFGDAPMTSAGDYKDALAMMEAKYYQVMLRKGQELRAVGIIQKTPYEAMNGKINQTFAVTVYNQDLAQVAREKMDAVGNPTDPVTVRATWTADNDGPAYVAVSASGNEDNRHLPAPLYKVMNPKPSPYTLKIKVEGDTAVAAATPQIARAQIAGGAGFGVAASLTPPALASSDLKLGETAFYKFPVKKGDPVQVSAAVQKPFYNAMMSGGIHATLTLTLYDDDQVQVAQKKIKVDNNPPDANTLSVTWPAKMSGSAYVSVTMINSGGSIYPEKFQPNPGRLSVQVSTVPGGAAPASSDKKTKDAFKGTESTDPPK